MVKGHGKELNNQRGSATIEAVIGFTAFLFGVNCVATDQATEETVGDDGELGVTETEQSGTKITYKSLLGY